MLMPALIPDYILVTGDRGFVGTHILNRWCGAKGLSELMVNADVRDKAALVACLEAHRPSAVVHLAAVSFVPDAIRDPEGAYETNFLGTLRLLQALADTGFRGRFLFVGTGDSYGRVSDSDLPIRENQPLRPRNPYAVSKTAAEALCYQWSQTGPFEVIMARPFNHIGPGQSPAFAIPDFARQIMRIKAGVQRPVITVGNIDVARDFTDVDDVVQAYGLLLTAGINGECYNVCTGKEHTLRSLIQKMLMLAGISAEIVIDTARVRGTEQRRIFGDAQKLASATGWKPETDIDTSLQKICNYWEQHND